MSTITATAIAHPNIAFIKYWGNRFNPTRLPANGSISMNLEGLTTQTRVTFSPGLTADSLRLNNLPATPPAIERVSRFLDHIRSLAGVQFYAAVESENNFPTGAGIASSASAFAALSLAATRALGLTLDDPQLSRLARLGSGSACRSIPGGFVEWWPGSGDADSFAFSLYSPEHWPLVDCIAVIAAEHKTTGSTEGHASANSSPLQAARVSDAPRRLALCRAAIRQRDFDTLAAVIELDSNMMHAVMMSSTPPLFYWEPTSLAIMKAVPELRKTGLPACFTLDAGPNVHIITTAAESQRIADFLRDLPGVQRVLIAPIGGAARIL